MDGRQDRIIIIETFRLGTATRRVRRIKGQLGQEPLAAVVASGDLLQLGDVDGPESSVVVRQANLKTCGGLLQERPPERIIRKRAF